MRDLLNAIALLLAIEGLLFAVFPDTMRILLARTALEPRELLRRVGLVSALVGVGLLWLVH
ncbi:DUF2065 family protein [Rhodovulum sp. DZ06]|uniref:DUF2065 family protein n=1 Tax=Rhodovulum sp. DZ06 TaxID=3425126 RepID=UPI003D335173